jgi:hypothetical protein
MIPSFKTRDLKSTTLLRRTFTFDNPQCRNPESQKHSAAHSPLMIPNVKTRDLKSTTLLRRTFAFNNL